MENDKGEGSLPATCTLGSTRDAAVSLLFCPMRLGLPCLTLVDLTLYPDLHPFLLEDHLFPTPPPARIALATNPLLVAFPAVDSITTFSNLMPHVSAKKAERWSFSYCTKDFILSLSVIGTTLTKGLLRSSHTLAHKYSVGSILPSFTTTRIGSHTFFKTFSANSFFFIKPFVSP